MLDLAASGCRSPRHSAPAARRSRGGCRRAARASRRARRRSPRGRSRRRASAAAARRRAPAPSSPASLPPGSRRALASAAASSGGSVAASPSRSAICPRGTEAVAHGGEIARAAAVERQPRQRARHDRAPLAALRAVGSRSAASSTQEADRIEPRVDRVGIGRAALASRAASSRAPAAGHGAVDRRRAGVPRALAGQRADQFEIGARRRVDEQASAARLARRRRTAPGARRSGSARHRRRHAADGRQLGAREGAEAVERRDAEEAASRRSARGAVEQVARRRGVTARRLAASSGLQLGVVEERCRRRSVRAGSSARELGGEPRRASHLGDAELAGRDVDPGEAEARLGVARRPAARDGDQPSCSRRASSSVSSVSVPGVTSRTTSRRTTDLAPRFCASAGILESARRRRRGGRARSAAADSRRRACDRHAAHRDVLAQMLAALGQRDAERRGWRSRRRRRTARRNRPSDRTAGNPGLAALISRYCSIIGVMRAGASASGPASAGTGARSISMTSTLADGPSPFIGPSSLSNGLTLR